MNTPSTPKELKSVQWGPWSSQLTLCETILGSNYKLGFEGVGFSLDDSDDSIAMVHQVHGCRVIEASEESSIESADGIFSNTRTVGVKTADCLPALVGNLDNPLATAIHAGWRGFTAGILSHGIKQVYNDVPMSRIGVSLGPCICQKCFEVGPEVVSALKNKSLGFKETQLKDIISVGKLDRSHVDLQLAAVFQLLSMGVTAEHISVDRRCTFCTKSLHSYRRDQSKSGRNISWIARK